MPVAAKIKPAAGNAAIIARMQGIQPAIVKALLRETNGIMLDVMRDSKTIPPMVPVDTGALQSTGRVEPSEINGSGMVSAVLLYGGEKGVDYAVYVHENMNAKFQRPGGGPKFVEAHMKRRAQEIPERISKAIKNAAGGK